MNEASALRALKAIRRRGHTVSFRRLTSALPQTLIARADIKAVVEGYTPDELTNGITSGTRKVIVSRLELKAAGFPMPVVKGDRIYLGDAFDCPTTIQAIDPDHREYQGCFDVITKGA